MTLSIPNAAFRACCFTAALLLGACGSTSPKLSPSSARVVDFSGHWELNYAQSDNIQERLNALVRELRKRSQARGTRPGEVGAPALSIGGVSDGASVLSLARMAEYITRSALLKIEQSDDAIEVDREGNFALDCHFSGAQAWRAESSLGREFCGWDGHQLLFTLLLPDGLSIRHRFTLSPDAKQMQIASTVVSDQVAVPFTLSRVYHRFDPANAGFRCEQTLTRGKVCTTEQP